MKSQDSFLINPIPVKVHDENDNQKIIALVFSKPIEGVIYLIIVGKTTDAVIQRVEMDASVGFINGYLNIINELNQQNPKSFFIKEFPHQNYNYAYKEVIEFGAGIAITIYKQKKIREALSTVYKNENIIWGLNEKEAFVTIKESDFKGKNFALNFWQKSDDGNYVIPDEAAKIWTQLLINDSDEGSKLAEELYNAFQSGKKKQIAKISEEIENLLHRKQ